MESAVRILPQGQATASIIWLHGLGADGQCPHAPHRPVALNGGYVMRAWYDIFSPDLRQVDLEGFERSREIVEAFIREEESAGIPASRIVLAGFSQGGAVALDTGLRFGERLGGIMALSAYLPGEGYVAGCGIPIFMAHGIEDAIVPFGLALESKERLEGLCRGVA